MKALAITQKIWPMLKFLQIDRQTDRQAKNNICRHKKLQNHLMIMNMMKNNVLHNFFFTEKILSIHNYRLATCFTCGIKSISLSSKQIILIIFSTWCEFCEQISRLNPKKINKEEIIWWLIILVMITLCQSGCRLHVL
jgi:thioredoxin-related protein